MTTLRERVVEAGARAAFEAEWDTVTWEEAKASYREDAPDGEDLFYEHHRYYYQAAEAALDAMLDCLEVNSDEWDAQRAAFDNIPRTDRGKLLVALAVLREDR